MALFFSFSSLFLDTSGKYHRDSKAFLFSLVNNNSRGSISCHSILGLTFGGGYDISIYNNAPSSGEYTYSDLGWTYSPPSGYSYGSTFARTFLAGTYRFIPDEVETFYETT